MKVSFPKNSILSKSKFDYVDCYVGNLERDSKNLNATDIGKAFFNSSPKWIDNLLKLRDKMVSVFGLKTSESLEKENTLKDFKVEVDERVGLFKVFQKTENELILGEDDKHLDFKVSLLLDKINQNLTITTAVNFNNWFGKLYFAIVKPVHKMIVPSMLKETIKALNKIRKL